MNHSPNFKTDPVIFIIAEPEHMEISSIPVCLETTGLKLLRLWKVIASAGFVWFESGVTGETWRIYQHGGGTGAW